MGKLKRILSFFGRENKREELRPQTETSRTDNVDEDKLSDTDEREPLAEPKAKAARRNFQSTCMVGKIQVVDTWSYRLVFFFCFLKRIKIHELDHYEILMTKLQENVVQHVFYSPDVNE